MAKKKIKPIDFDKAIEKVLLEYGEEVNEALETSVSTVASEAAEKLKAKTVFNPERHPTGKYAASWISEQIAKGRVYTKTVVHNLEHYRLTHLLEKGHVSRNGTGRTFGKVPAYPHIADVNEWVQTALPEDVKRRLSK